MDEAAPHLNSPWPTAVAGRERQIGIPSDVQGRRDDPFVRVELRDHLAQEVVIPVATPDQQIRVDLEHVFRRARLDPPQRGDQRSPMGRVRARRFQTEPPAKHRSGLRPLLRSGQDPVDPAMAD
ncbi:MAG: hypothetical protein KDC98_12450, partial [Planctomycetes bacterium]|nr:hypothetical protein [Planctomycetota bacterium]